jgi:hypothetical protein
VTADVCFIEDLFPLVISIGPLGGFDERQVRLMDEYYESLWKRGERYAIVSHSPKAADATGARGRRLIVDWANSPRVKAMSRKYCVGSTTVVPNAVARGALTAILWLWSPSSPHQACSTPEEAIDWSVARLVEAGISMPHDAATMSRLARKIVKEDGRDR